MKNPLLWLKKLGVALINSEYSADHCKALCEAKFTAKEAKFFINLLAPFLSLVQLHRFNAGLLSHAMAQDADTYLREATGNLVKASLIHEAKKYRLFNVEDQEIARLLCETKVTPAFYASLYVSDAIKDHFANIILPATKRVGSHLLNPPRDLATRFYFNIINPVIFNDIIPTIQDPELQLLANFNGKLLSNQFNSPSSSSSSSSAVTIDADYLVESTQRFISDFYRDVCAYSGKSFQPAIDESATPELLANSLASFQRLVTMHVDANETYSLPSSSQHVTDVNLKDNVKNDLIRAFASFSTHLSLLFADTQETKILFNNRLVLHRNYLPNKSQSQDLRLVIQQMRDLLLLPSIATAIFLTIYANLQTSMGIFLEGLSRSKLPNQDRYVDNLTGLMSSYRQLCETMDGVCQILQLKPIDTPAPVVTDNRQSSGGVSEHPSAEKTDDDDDPTAHSSRAAIATSTTAITGTPASRTSYS